MKNIWQVDLEEALERLAEVEAERDAVIAGSREIRGALLDAEARLAKVEALWAEHNNSNGGFKDLCVCFGCKMAAATRGEGDRPAAPCGDHCPGGCGYDPENPDDPCGEGDR